MLHAATRGGPSDFLTEPAVSLNDSYLIVNAVDGLAAGSYVFDRARGALELLKQGDFRRHPVWEREERGGGSGGGDEFGRGLDEPEPGRARPPAECGHDLHQRFARLLSRGQPHDFDARMAQEQPHQLLPRVPARADHHRLDPLHRRTMPPA